MRSIPSRLVFQLQNAQKMNLLAKILLVLGWTLFGLGILFKNMHWPMAGQLLLAGAFLQLIHAAIGIVVNAKKDLPLAFLFLATTSVTVYATVRILQWGNSFLFLGISALFVLTWLVLHFLKKARFGMAQVGAVLCLVALIGLSFVPNHRLYYAINLSHESQRTYGYDAWDHYSWLLNQSGLKEEALDANEQSTKALEIELSEGGSLYAIEYQGRLQAHREQIIAGTWQTYP
jgi:hypothetical protein